MARQSDQAEVPTIPRVAFEDLPPDVVSALRPRVERLGYLGEFFQVAAHQPEVLLAFDRFTEAGKAALGPRLTEVVALTVAGALANRYELHQHERLSVRLGYGREWVEAVESRRPDAEGPLAPDERDVQRLVLALLDDHGRGARATLEAFARRHGPALAVGVLFVFGRYEVHGLVVNASGVTPSVPSIFDDGFDGD